MRFQHKGLERLFTSGRTNAVNAQHVRKLMMILAALNATTSPSGLNFPGGHLHPLKGGRKGQWAISVSGNLRVVFRFEGQDVTDVDLVDYH